MTAPVPAVPGEWRVVSLPDGRTVEYIWAEYVGEALDVGPGYRRLDVAVLLDGDVVTMPVVLSPEQVAAALGGAS